MMGEAYSDLVADRGILLTLMHLFGLGYDPTLGPFARACFMDAYRIVRDEAGLSPAETTRSSPRACSSTVVHALRMPDEVTDADAAELMAYTFGDKMSDVVAISHKQLPIVDARR